MQMMGKRLERNNIRKQIHFTGMGLIPNQLPPSKETVPSDFSMPQYSGNPIIRSWLRISLFNLLVAISIGALLRFAFVTEIGWMEFKNFLHAHSHVAMLGWVYLALFSLFIQSFLEPTFHNKTFYKVLFWGTQLTVLGMLVAFPLMGYAALSIFFSSLHVVFSYIFTWRFLKDLKATSPSNSISVKFIKTALFFMVFSTVALWAMAPIIILGYKGSSLYHMAIQFYLHFQFNGWFIFGVLGLFFKMLENYKIEIHNETTQSETTQSFYRFLFISCFLTYALAITWSTPIDIIFWINSLGVAFQFAAIIYFLKIINQVKLPIMSKLNWWSLLLFKISFISFLLKVFIQTAILIPYIAIVAYTVRNFAMGFIHLMLLGVVTSFLFAFGNYQNLFNLKSILSKAGIVCFLIGFILSEFLLFFQGLLLWQAMGFLPFYYEGIFMASVLMPIGIGLLFVGVLNKA